MLVRKLNRLQVLPIASACTGSNITRLALEMALRNLGSTCRVAELFMCEKDELAST
jgi:hypothetical protein